MTGGPKRGLARLALVLIVFFVVFPGGTGGARSGPTGENTDDLALTERSLEAITRAADELSNLASVHTIHGRPDAARETRQDLETVAGVLSNLLDRLDRDSKRLARAAGDQALKGKAEEARSHQDRWKRVVDLRSRFSGRLASIRKVLGEKSAEAAPVAGSPFRGRRERLRMLPDPDRKAIRAGLRWLKDHQHSDGYWDSDGFMKLDRDPPESDGAGQAIYDSGVTGLALLAFLGAGHSTSEGDFQEAVSAGLRYLRSIQDPDGCFGPRKDGHFVYNHAVCAQAMAEAYGMTGSPLFRESAQKAVDFIEKARNPYLAWRYGVRPGENDTSVTGWMVSALAAARVAGLKTSREAFLGAWAWIDRVTDPTTGRVGYTKPGTGPARPFGLLEKWPAEKSESLTAIGILVRIHAGEEPRRSLVIGKGVNLCLGAPPVWDTEVGTIDPYYWYSGSFALHQIGGKAWSTWKKAVAAALTPNQRSGPKSFAGSWDPRGPWGHAGGRVYSTALCTLILETEARCVRVFPRK